jgi:hypothetical protein
MRTIFKLKTGSTAIFAENDQRSAIPIPVRATVVLLSGNIDEDAFVKIRYENKILFMLSEDLRNGGERWEERHRASLSILDWTPIMFVVSCATDARTAISGGKTGRPNRSRKAD